MRAGFVAFFGLVMQIAPTAKPPHILQIHREALKPGSEAAYHAIEEDTARICEALGCPHPYLGAESLTGPKEVWWFNGYESSAEQRQVYDEYAKNTQLMAALQESSQRKESLTLQPIEVFANYRPDSSDGTPWMLGRGRFLVITVTKSDRQMTGSVFESLDGTRYVITSAQTREQADAAVVAAGPESTIFGVRATWSFPAKEWTAADPLFWQPSSPAERE
jgi:hypothetical protein